MYPSALQIPQNLNMSILCFILAFNKKENRRKYGMRDNSFHRKNKKYGVQKFKSAPFEMNPLNPVTEN